MGRIPRADQIGVRQLTHPVAHHLPDWSGSLAGVAAVAILYVQDLDRLRAFYVGCFDFVAVEQEKDFVVLRSDYLELTLVAAPDEIVRRNTVTDPPARRESVPVKLGLWVRSIEAARPVLEPLGGVPGDPATEWEFRGVRRCDATDPEGNIIQLLEPKDAPAG